MVITCFAKKNAKPKGEEIKVIIIIGVGVIRRIL